MNKRKKKQTTLKKNNILRAGVLLALLFGLFIFTKLTYAKNITYYPHNDGFFMMNIYINSKKVSVYEVECKANELEDIPGATAASESQSYINDKLKLIWGSDTVAYGDYRAYTIIDSVDFSTGYWTFENRQYVWTFPYKSKTYGYHLTKAEDASGNVQSGITGASNGNFEIRTDTNGLGITHYETPEPYHNTFNIYLESNKYTLKYDGNGATGGSVPDRECKFGENFNIANNGFTRTGYTFTGWKDEAGNTYSEGQGASDLVADDGGTITLYAQWEADNYSITYHANDDELDKASGIPSAQSYSYCDDIETLSSDKPSRSGYTFLGWSKDAHATDASYVAGGQIAKEANNIDLYAIWSINSYKQTNNFYKNKNGTWVKFGNSVVHNAQYRSYYKNTTKGFTGDTTGYHFWKFATDGWTVLGDKNDKDGYGYYSPNEYTIKYDSNGATSGVMKNGALNGKTDTTNLKYDVSYNLRSCTYKRTGYHFIGWATSKDAANSKIASYSDASAIKNLTSTNGGTVTLYAVWEPNKYTVIYNGNGATSGSVASQTCYYDTQYSYSQNSGPGFKNEDRTSRSLFVGWGTNKNGTGSVYTPGTKFKNLTSENGGVVNLYAIWEADNNDYTITVNPNGGFVTYNGTQYTTSFTFTGKYGTTFELDVSEKTTDAVKWFNKWTLSNVDALSILDNPDVKFVGRIQGNGTVTANWSNMINITVDPNGGLVNGHTEKFVIQGKSNDPFILDFSFCDYDLKNVKFNTSGCATTKYAYVKAADYNSSYAYDTRTDVYTTDTNTFTPNGKATISYAAYNMVKSGTITVNWNIPDTTSIYTITLDDNGGTGGDGQIYEKYGFGFYADTSASVEITAVENIPKLEGHTFLGYYSKKDSGEQIIDSKGTIIVNPDYFSKNSTIYAMWKENEVPETEYQVEHYLPSINANNGSETYSSNPTLTEYYMGKEGSTINIQTLEKTDDTFQGYSYSYATNSKGEVITTAKVTSGMVIKIYYTGKYYKVTANKSTGIEKTEVSGNVTVIKDGETYYKTGTYVTVKATCLPDYSFATWTCTSGGIASSTSETYKFVMPGSDVNITAYSTADPDIIYSIKYELNGGNDPLNPVLYTKKTPTFTLNNPTKSNATFEGWTGTGLTDKTKEVTIHNGSTGNREYTANWHWNIYKITLDNQNADTPGTSEYYEQYSIGNFSTKDLTSEITKITIPTKTGYDFRGYYDKLTQTDDIDPKQYIDADGNIIALNTDFTSDTTLYAIWTPSVYKVTLDNQGASSPGTKFFYCKYNDDFYQDETCYVRQNEDIFKPKKDTYVFKGYYTEKNGKGIQYINSDGKIDSELKKITSDLTLYAFWENKAYNLTIELGYGISNAKIAGHVPISIEENKVVYSIKHGEEITLEAVEKDGYSFKEWLCPSGKIPSSYEKMYTITMPPENTLVQVNGQANKYTIIYNANGGTGDDVSGTVKYDETIQLIENPFTNDTMICSFVGWSLDSTEMFPKYKALEYVDVLELVKELGLEKTPGGIITLYAIWDEAPTIIASDRYFTLQDAINGTITEEELFNKASATDREDGSISPGITNTPRGDTKFEIEGFDPTSITTIDTNTDIDITFKATDSSGNETSVTITIHVVDTAASLVDDYFYIRSMNLKYITKEPEEGGLEADSIWRQPAYYSILYNAVNSVEVDNKDTVSVNFGGLSMEGEVDGTGTHRGTPKQSWSFSRDDLDSIRQYVDNHGVGNSKEDDALANFITQFSGCKK